MAKSVAVSLVSSRLDYANSLMFGKSASNLHKFQRVQNTLAKTVLNNSAITSATALQQLHWLPIKQCIHFKIATVTYRILQTGSPAYLSGSQPSSTSTLLSELSDLHRVISYMSRSPARLSIVKPLDMLLLQFGILSHSTSDIHLLLVPLNVI